MISLILSKYFHGRANHVADTLSRNAAVPAIPEINSFPLQNKAAAQRAGHVWSANVYVVEFGNNVNLPELPVSLTQYVISNDVLCRNVMVSLNLLLLGPLFLLSCTFFTVPLKLGTQVVTKPWSG